MDIKVKQAWTADECELTVQFVQKHTDLPTPACAHDGDASWDLPAVEAMTIMPQMQKLITTRLQVAIPPGCYLCIAL
ncbi:hypothetical protein H4R24_004698 [Coemansia sp. RSA 988]|nr:hypothetical protein H4R24_004698 [Coemansia sp. RSA 988]